jgi:hypothetical protein
MEDFSGVEFLESIDAALFENVRHVWGCFDPEWRVGGFHGHADFTGTHVNADNGWDDVSLERFEELLGFIKSELNGRWEG